jgi:short subunit dehydrogenase-like uncharacterized protein
MGKAWKSKSQKSKTEANNDPQVESKSNKSEKEANNDPQVESKSRKSKMEANNDPQVESKSHKSKTEANNDPQVESKSSNKKKMEANNNPQVEHAEDGTESPFDDEEQDDTESPVLEEEEEDYESPVSEEEQADTEVPAADDRQVEGKQDGNADIEAQVAQDDNTETDATNIWTIHAPVERDGNAISPASTQMFALALILGVPFWLGVLIPLMILSQLLKAFITCCSEDKEISLDTGNKLEGEIIIPREDRTYDVIILGVTGFTGRLAALHLAMTYGCKGSEKGVKWAIAGRSKEKLEEVKQSLADELENTDILNIPVFVVDTSVPSTLLDMVRDTRVLISMVRPFRKYGNNVVEFCVKFGTHYADTTEETDWAQAMMNQWQDTAKQSGAKIIPFCGCNSIPWDLSALKLAQFLQEQKKEDLSRVRFVDEISSGHSDGTLDSRDLSSMVMVLNGNDVPDIGKAQPFRLTADGDMHSEKFQRSLPFLIRKLKLPWLGEEDQTYGSFGAMSLVNSKVVSWTQALRQGAKLSYTECTTTPDFKTAFVRYFGTIAFVTAVLNPITAFLLYKLVIPSPGEGPSMEKMTTESYAAIYAEGVGTGGSKVESLMYFRECPACIETARMVVESGLSLALSETELPSRGGGFFSPAYGLGNVLLNRLMKTGTHFTVRLKEEDEHKHAETAQC